MLVKVALAAGACLLASNPGANANPITRMAPARSVKATTWKAAAFSSASPNKVSSNVLELTKIKTSRENKRSAAWNIFGGSTQLQSLEIGEEFATEIDISGQKFQVIVDTGSSDTWVVEKGFECVSVSNGSDVVAESVCAFGPTYTSGSSFKQIPNEFFNITYGDGEFLNGVMGTNQITLAGIEVTQEIALVNYAGWTGDGVTSGLTGLAFPALYGSSQLLCLQAGGLIQPLAQAPSQTRQRNRSSTIRFSPPCTRRVRCCRFLALPSFVMSLDLLGI